jgi:sensor histidine kinase regulating citrate/malate metabolism
MATVGEGVVVTSQFIQAARDAGYTNLATALGELIDNALPPIASSCSPPVGQHRTLHESIEDLIPTELGEPI